MPTVDILPEYEVDIDDDTYAKIWKKVMESEKYRPMRIFFDEPYDKVAFYVEHGTGPAQPGKKEPPRSDGLTARDRIGQWVANKDPTLKGPEFVEKRNEMYEQIMQSGTPPHPFIRPAAQDLFENGGAQKILSTGGTTEDVAETMKQLMIRYLTDNGSVMGNEADSITRHIHYEPYQPGEEERSTSPYRQSTIIREWERLDDVMASKHAQNYARYIANRKGAKK